ncbi:MAG: exonuclease SbcCD subunit D [Clostridia bacterium]|nr:exonuclease SbcCD subunit D [Clostridia bacterium]
MKFIHLSDLHLGKKVNEYSMAEDQRYILKEILGIIDEEKPDAVIIAGDVYDKSVPTAEATEILDDFLVRLSKKNLEVFVISGNHDSPERLAFGNRLMDASGIHLSPVYNGSVTPFCLEDDFGSICVYMLPFIKPANVRGFFPDEQIDSYTDALKVAIDKMNISPESRNVLITHQFVVGASRSDSEDISVGGTDGVEASVFDSFDYVALGHIHGPQSIGSERIRYCGTPLKYSFSEASHTKSVTVAEIGNKGELTVRTVPLVPLRDMKELRGSYSELMSKSFYENTSYREDYTHITLTDEDDIPDAVSKLRVVYTNLMKLDYDNRRTRSVSEFSQVGNAENKSPLELFSELYLRQNGSELSGTQSDFLGGLIERIWEGEE